MILYKKPIIKKRAIQKEIRQKIDSIKRKLYYIKSELYKKIIQRRIIKGKTKQKGTI